MRSVGGAGGGAAREIEAEAELVEQRQLEAGERGAERAARSVGVERADGEAEQPVVRVALGQQAQVVAEELAGVEAGAVGDEVGGAGVDQLDDEGAEMLLEPGAPGELDGVAGLQRRRELRRAAAADEARGAAPLPSTMASAMTLISPWRRTPMMRPSPRPLHGCAVYLLPVRVFQPHLAVALGVVAPFLADLDEEEQVHRHLEHLHQLLAGFGADRLDGLAAGAEDDLLVACRG